MAVLRSLAALTQKFGAIARQGRFTIPLQLFGRANLQHERVSGLAPPGGGRLVYAGHDHAFEGGLPLPRGCRFYLDHGNGSDLIRNIEGSTYAYDEWHDIIGNRSVLFKCSATPGLEGTAVDTTAPSLEGYVLADVNSISGTLKIALYHLNTSTRSSDIDITSTGLVWGSWTDIPFTSGDTNEYMLQVRGNNAVEVQIQALMIFESRFRSQPQQADGSVYSSVGRP